MAEETETAPAEIIPLESAGDTVSDTAKEAQDSSEAGSSAATPAEETPREILLEELNFEIDSFRITPEARKWLQSNIQILMDHPEATVNISGYTSMSGTDEYNLNLSKKRAEAVKEMLVREGGINPARITTAGYGKADPVIPETDPEDAHSEAARANARAKLEVVSQ